MSTEIYPVIIPPNLKLARTVKHDIRHVDKKPLDESDLSQYDRKTIFYDVFFNPSNTTLYALGPPLLNLESELSPISINVNYSKVKFKLIKLSGNQLNLLSISFNNKNLQKLLQEVNNISIKFGNKWIWEGNIPINKLQDKATLTLSTLQKNNKIQWIKDWIHYYREVHDVERIIFYDNDSEYQSTLDRELNIPNIHIVHWNFLFGPTRSYHNHFCKVGFLNHCRLKFSNDKFHLNFDIDEILVVKDKEKLFNNLNKYAVVYFDSFNVPFVKPSNPNYSFSDFLLRDRKSNLEKGRKSYKYIYKLANARMNWPHKVETNTYDSRIIIFSNFFRKANKLLAHLKVFLNPLITNHKPVLNDSYKFDIKDAYFLHFIGITTNWKSSYWNRLEERKHTEDLIEDLSVVEFFNK